MKREKDIWIYNNGKYERERICAEKWMRLIYENPVGSAGLLFLMKRKVVSRIYGAYCRTAFSARQIPKFIEQNQIDMTGCRGPYKSYAEFFSRARDNVLFPQEQNVLGSPCEGMVSVYDNIDPQKLIAAKGSYFSLAELFYNAALAKEYAGGVMVSIRLTPANYHRAHFFDDGVVTSSKIVDGHLYSVSPLALRRIARLYCLNKRALVSFASKNFGDVAMVEVGATFVGSIVHCFEKGKPVRRGDQAAYFLPGGSLLLMFFKKGAFAPNSSLVQQTKAGYETKTQIGAPLGEKPN